VPLLLGQGLRLFENVEVHEIKREKILLTAELAREYLRFSMTN